MENQKNRSRNASVIETDDWINVHKDEPCEFIGYDYLEAEIKILKYRKISQKGKSFFQAVFNTPFYPEGGGQVGDSGWIENEGLQTAIFGKISGICKTRIQQQQTAAAEFGTFLLKTAMTHMAPRIRHPKQVSLLNLRSSFTRQAQTNHDDRRILWRSSTVESFWLGSEP